MGFGLDFGVRVRVAHQLAVKSTTTSLSPASACALSHAALSASWATPPRRRSTW